MTTLDGYVKSHTTYALRRAIRDVWTGGHLSIRHWSAVKRAPRFVRGVPSPLTLNVGCGANSRPGWLNIDLFDPAPDLELDLRKHWPFPDASVAYIYSEHVFEHFEFAKEVPQVLSESLRVL